MEDGDAGIGGTGNEDAGSAGVESADGDGPSEDWGGLAQQQATSESFSWCGA